MITCHNAFNVWPKTTLLPVWARDAKRLDITVNKILIFCFIFIFLTWSHPHYEIISLSKQRSCPLFFSILGYRGQKIIKNYLNDCSIYY